MKSLGFPTSPFVLVSAAQILNRRKDSLR